MKFIQRLKNCSDATSNEDSPNDDNGKQTFEEVCYTSSQFKGVRTPLDLAVLEYCACKFLAQISSIKNGTTGAKTKMNGAMSEDGCVVSIKIQKSDIASLSHYGTSDSSSSNSSSVPRHSWKSIGEYPIVARISPTLTVQGFRQMLGQRLSSALKLKQNDQQCHVPDDHCHDAAQLHFPDSSSLPRTSIVSPEMTIMNQVALSCESKESNGRTNHGYQNDGDEFGFVTMEDLTAKNTNAIAESKNKEEIELIGNIVENEGTIIVNWPSHLNDAFEEDVFFAKDEFWTEKQTKARKEEEDNGIDRTRKKNSISVMDCISKYCEMEELDETDMWYCNKCKEHVRAWKQFHLYRTPPILIIHLKRFHFSSTTHRRDKIDTLIDFPLIDLDLRGVVGHSEEENKDSEDPLPVYDCYAVSNHFGGLGGGHYTAYAKGDDGVWCNFDDSRVTTVGDESEVVSSAAYCLYYKRKDVDAADNDEDAIVKDVGEDMPVLPSPGSTLLKQQHDIHDSVNMEVDSNNQVDLANTGSSSSYKSATTDDSMAMDGNDTSLDLLSDDLLN